MVPILIAGFGFMGRTHVAELCRLRGASLAGVVDPRGEQVRDALEDVAGPKVPIIGALDAALESCECVAVDICLPTDMHRETAELAFAAGKHVFCEKPIALTVADAEAMVRAAERAGKQFMVGHCIRFWPEYEALKRAVDSGEFGRLISLSMSRRNSRPDYAVGGWVNDPARCVGAALDIHIHDTDFVCHLLGVPRAVAASGVSEPTGWNSIAGTYDFGPGGPLVFADGAWNYPKGWGFQMRFSAVFENAAMDFDSRANPSLMLARGADAPCPVPLPEPATDGYRRELEYFVGRLEAGLPVEISTGKQASLSLAVTLAEIASAAAGGRRIPLQT